MLALTQQIHKHKLSLNVFEINWKMVAKIKTSSFNCITQRRKKYVKPSPVQNRWKCEHRSAAATNPIDSTALTNWSWSNSAWMHIQKTVKQNYAYGCQRIFAPHLTWLCVCVCVLLHFDIRCRSVELYSPLIFACIATFSGRHHHCHRHISIYCFSYCVAVDGLKPR